jgi:hypothetical protein
MRGGGVGLRIYQGIQLVPATVHRRCEYHLNELD